MTGYRSAMHRKSREMHRYTFEDRTAMKKASISERQRIKNSLSKPRPFRGLVNVLDSIKRRKKESKNATNIKGSGNLRHQQEK